MRRCLVLLIAISFVIPAFAQKKKNKKADMPMAVVAAQFVYVTSLHGGPYDPGTSMEERAAIHKTEDALRAWGKYRVVLQPESADLMLIVKPGAIAQSRVGVDVGNDPNYPGVRIGRPGIGIGQSTGVDLSSTPDDMLMVSLSPQEAPDSTPVIWRRSARHGFSGNKPILIEAFRDAVDEAANQNQSTKP